MFFTPTFTAGDSFSNVIELSGYESADNTLNWFLRGAGVLSGTATNNLDGSFTIQIASGASSAIAPGHYQFYSYITNSTTLERISLPTESTQILPDPSQTIAQSFSVRMLAAVEALLERRATNNQLDLLRTNIDAKELERMNPNDLLLLRDKFKLKVAVENRAASGKNTNTNTNTMQRILYNFNGTGH